MFLRNVGTNLQVYTASQPWTEILFFIATAIHVFLVPGPEAYTDYARVGSPNVRDQSRAPEEIT
jgi:hypothetical protein